MKDKNVFIIERILKYIKEIEGTVLRFQLDFERFKDDYVVKNAISMSLLQIGELSGKLTDDLELSIILYYGAI
jgi:uncharacterized protein with HEPN domain